MTKGQICAYLAIIFVLTIPWLLEWGWFIPIILILGAILLIWCAFEVYIECFTPALKELNNLSKQYTKQNPWFKVQLETQTWRCDSKNEFDRWGNAAIAHMETILDKHEEFVRALPANMNELYRNYKIYSGHVTALYQQLEGPFLMHKQKKFKNRIQPPPDNIVMKVKVTYTSPQGRNSYAHTYAMHYQDAVNYIKTFPTAENTYLPDAFLHQNNKFEDCAGTYVLYNQQDDKYYVGQATSFQRRLHQHFTGKGNPDVYFYYRLGKPFTVYIFPLTGSRFATLNDQERHYIAKYKAFEEGYNKTHGNM